jgi:hypothetical protein
MTPNPKGQLLVMAEAAKRGAMSVSTLRALLHASMGPPGFKRPGSNRWLFYTNEFDQWLERLRPLR